MGCSTEDLLSFAAGVVSPDLIRLLKPTASSDFTSRLKLRSPSLPSLNLSSRSLLDDAANDFDSLFDAVTNVTHFGCLPLGNGEHWHIDEDDENTGAAPRDRKTRAPNRFPYVFGDLAAAAWHTKFLAVGEVRRKTETLSLDRTSTFRGEFRLPLYKIEYLVSLFRERRWIDFSHYGRTEAKLKIKSELLRGREHPGSSSVSSSRWKRSLAPSPGWRLPGLFLFSHRQKGAEEDSGTRGAPRVPVQGHSSSQESSG